MTRPKPGATHYKIAKQSVDVSWVDAVPVAIGSWRRNAVDGNEAPDRYLEAWLSARPKKEDVEMSG